MSDQSDKNTESRIDWSETETTRRKALQAIAAGTAGFSFTQVSTGVISGTSDATTEIIYAIRRNKSDDSSKLFIEKKKEVPADWYEDVQHAEQAYKNSQIATIIGVVEFDVLPAKYSGRNSQLRVGISKERANEAGKDVEDVEEKIPDTVDGVEVVIDYVGVPTLTSCYDNDQGDIVPGGAKVSEVDGGYGSLSAAMYPTCCYAPEGRFATNQHIWADKSGYPPQYDMYHPEEYDDAIGDIYKDDCELDFVMASGINGHSPTSDIVGTGLTVQEQYTQDGISDLAAQDETATKRGVRTCETSGKIVTANGYIGFVDKGCGDRGHQVKGEWYTDDGDSGSTVYRDIGNGEAAALSMHAGKDPMNGNGFGFGAYWLKEEGGYAYV